jgi:hypothetical protein
VWALARCGLSPAGGRLFMPLVVPLVSTVTMSMRAARAGYPHSPKVVGGLRSHPDVSESGGIQVSAHSAFRSDIIIANRRAPPHCSGHAVQQRRTSAATCNEARLAPGSRSASARLSPPAAVQSARDATNTATRGAAAKVRCACLRQRPASCLSLPASRERKASLPAGVSISRLSRR